MSSCPSPAPHCLDLPCPSGRLRCLRDCSVSSSGLLCPELTLVTTAGPQAAWCGLIRSLPPLGQPLEGCGLAQGASVGHVVEAWPGRGQAPGRFGFAGLSLEDSDLVGLFNPGSSCVDDIGGLCSPNSLWFSYFSHLVRMAPVALLWLLCKESTPKPGAV